MRADETDGNGYSQHSEAQSFRRSRLQPTLRNALRTDFYANLWRGIDINNVSLDTLHLLPLVTKESIRSADHSAQLRDTGACRETFTMGTTSQPLVTIHTEEERKAIASVISRWRSRSSTNCQRRAVKFNDPNHGTHIVVPASLFSHRVSIHDEGSFDYARALLSSNHNDKGVESRCSLLIGSTTDLFAFTIDSLDWRDPRSGLEFIYLTGSYLTSRRRRIMESVWQATVVDRFSLSEIFGGATESLACGWWHFDPFVIPEVIGARSGKPILEGVGLLALTALHPFQQAQPMIRYLTGDLVRVTHKESSKPGNLAIMPLGRAIYGVEDPSSDDWFVAPVSLLEILDDCEVIRRTPLFLDISQVKDSEAIGFPRYHLSCERDVHTKVKISLDLRNDVTIDRVEELRRGITRQLRIDSGSLAKALDDGRATLDITLDGDLRPDDVSRP